MRIMQANSVPKKEIHGQYEKFLSHQTHVKPRTLALMTQTMRTFPDPEKLNGDHFRERMKKVAIATIHYEVGLARRFLKWADMDGSSLQRDRLRLPKMEESVTPEDLYTKEELDCIFKALAGSRDRAMVKVLWEAALRAGELLSMKIENLRFWSENIANAEGEEVNREFASIIVSGKTKTRELLLELSVPELRKWINEHPLGEEGKGPVWISRRRGNIVIGYDQLFQVVKTALGRVGFNDKKRIIHMFRHTRITELYAAGFRGQSLSHFAGWTKSSNMENVYAHLSTTDMNNEYRAKVLGHETIETPRPKVTLATCLKCGHKNPHGTSICDGCNTPLIVNQAKIEEILEEQGKTAELEERVKYLETQLEALQAMLSVAIEINEEVLQRLEKQEAEKI